MDVRLNRCCVYRANPLSGFFQTLMFFIVCLYLSASAIAQEIIVDDSDNASVNFTGPWTSSTSSQAHNSNLHYVSGSSDTFTWIPTIPADETYDVYVRWTHNSTRTREAHYDIVHATGTDRFTVNQFDPSLAGNWQYAGRYEFVAGTSGQVTLSGTEVGQKSADAIRLVAFVDTDDDGMADAFETTYGLNPSSAADANQDADNDEATNLEEFNAGTDPTVPSLLSPVIHPPGMDFYDALSVSLSHPNSAAELRYTTDGSEPTAHSTLYSGPITLAATTLVKVKAFATELTTSATTQASFAERSEIIIDNADLNTYPSNGWYTSSAQGYWGGDSQRSNSSASFTAEFRWYPTRSVPYAYEVYAWWTYYETRTSTAPYTVHHAHGSDTVIVDQLNPALASSWQPLGTYLFHPGNDQYINITSANGQVSADAVRWMRAADTDDDGHADVFDNCPLVINADQSDIDRDGAGDVCDDSDHDGLLDDVDNCPDTANPDQVDIDNDHIGDACDPLVDIDDDSIADSHDHCAAIPNPDQLDLDGDGIGDACDSLVDNDDDGLENALDNCPDVANDDQADLDSDGAGDVCEDSDSDTRLDAEDNGPFDVNTDQVDADADGLGDACDPLIDTDGDGVADLDDNGLITPNADQANLDGDAFGDLCDDDQDGDGLANDLDNCPSHVNPDQSDLNRDGIGDLCQPDFDPPQVAFYDSIAVLTPNAELSSPGYLRIQVTDDVDDEPQVTAMVMTRNGRPLTGLNWIEDPAYDDQYIIESGLLIASPDPITLSVTVRDYAGNQTTVGVTFTYQTPIIRHVTGGQTLDIPSVDHAFTTASGDSPLRFAFTDLNHRTITGIYPSLAVEGFATSVGSATFTYRVRLYDPGTDQFYSLAQDHHSISVSSASGYADFQPDRTLDTLAVAVDALNLGFSNHGEPCNVYLDRDQALSYAATRNTTQRPACYFEWTSLPAALTQLSYRAAPWLTGTVTTPGTHSIGWQVQSFAPDGTAITLQTESLAIEVQDIDSPVITFEPANPQHTVPVSGGWFGTLKTAGHNVATVVEIDRNGELLNTPPATVNDGQ